jgi:hypothetical protein
MPFAFCVLPSVAHVALPTLQVPTVRHFEPLATSNPSPPSFFGRGEFASVSSFFLYRSHDESWPLGPYSRAPARSHRRPWLPPRWPLSPVAPTALVSAPLPALAPHALCLLRSGP